MIGGLGGATNIPELRRRVLFTLMMLIIYRIGIFVPTPGIDAQRLKSIFQTASSELYGLINMFTGGALENFSIFALNIMPYISMSIVMQIGTYTIPHLENLSKEGDQGKRTITRYTRIGTIILALVHSTLFSIGLEAQGVVASPGWGFRITTVLTLTAGTAFLMWLGEQITEKGIGNGISLIIFAGIVARMPSVLAGTFDLMRTGELQPPKVLLLLLFGAAIIAFIVFIENSHRKIPVQYPKRAMGRRMTQATTQHLPLKLNSSGVIPPIFASMFLVFVVMVTQFAQNDFIQDFTNRMAPGTLWYSVIFGALIVFFCYFYTSLVFDPEKIAENLKKNGGFIPTVRPGKDTAIFLNTILNRLTFWGAIYICAVCIIPDIFYQRMGAGQYAYFFGGTAVLIVVGVTLDTMRQIEAHVVTRNYEGFMSKSPGKIRSQGRGMQGRGKLIQR
jgi:preprotein translocase subunit SecY